MKTQCFLLSVFLVLAAAVGRTNSESRTFEVGTVYRYSYETSTLLNEPLEAPVSSLKDVGFKIEADVNIVPLWTNPKDLSEQILHITTSSSNLFVKARKGEAPEGFMKKNSRLNGYASHPLVVHWKQGEVVGVYRIGEDELTLVNLKKGIASLLQYQYKNLKRQETDSSGKCEVTYQIVDKDKLLKSKANCKTVTDVPFYSHPQKVLGANIQSSAAVSFEFSPGDRLLNIASGVETHFLRVESRLEVGSEVISKQLLQRKGTSTYHGTKYGGKSVKEAIKSLEKNIGKKLIKESLATTPDPKECISCKSLQELINNFKKALHSNNLATQSSAISFLRILLKVRESNEETIKKALKIKKTSPILPQLLDIVAAAQTEASHKAAMAVLKFNDAQDIDLPERYLLALSLSTHPTDVIILDLLKKLNSKIPNEKLQETLLLTISALAHTYKLSGGTNNLVYEGVTKQIESNLPKCKDEPCKLKYIRAMKNLREKVFVPTLLEFIAGKEKKAATYAMRALQTMPPDFIDAKVIKSLEKVYFELDRRHDSTVRSLAANVILKNNPSDVFLTQLFEHLSSQDSKEVNTIVLSQIGYIMEEDDQIRQKVKQILKSSRLGNYNILGQNGLSTAFTRTLAQDKSSNSTFTNILEISGGLLKRSTVDVFVQNKDSKMNLLSFEMFAGGLSMFSSEENPSDEADTEDANAGIEVTLMNTQLRPYVFFTGQGELMGHVWSGTGSERTTALQGSVLLQDHKQYVPLQNGLTAEMVLTGVVSYDFAGQAEISLWNRNANSLVEMGAAVVIQGQARVDNSLVQTMIEFNTGTHSKLSFISDLDFSDKIRMCMQMIQPDFEIIENLRKLERIPGSKYMLRKYKKKVIPAAGKTYVMNKKNTQICNLMLS